MNENREMIEKILSIDAWKHPDDFRKSIESFLQNDVSLEWEKIPDDIQINLAHPPEKNLPLWRFHRDPRAFLGLYSDEYAHASASIKSALEHFEYTQFKSWMPNQYAFLTRFECHVPEMEFYENYHIQHGLPPKTLASIVQIVKEENTKRGLSDRDTMAPDQFEKYCHEVRIERKDVSQQILYILKGDESGRLQMAKTPDTKEWRLLLGCIAQWQDRGMVLSQLEKEQGYLESMIAFYPDGLSELQRSLQFVKEFEEKNGDLIERSEPREQSSQRKIYQEHKQSIDLLQKEIDLWFSMKFPLDKIGLWSQLVKGQQEFVRILNQQLTELTKDEPPQPTEDIMIHGRATIKRHVREEKNDRINAILNASSSSEQTYPFPARLHQGTRVLDSQPLTQRTAEKLNHEGE